MFVLVWWLAICSLKYTWGCEGLWTPQYPPNQPRVIHDWFPFQQKDWIRFWIYHQNNQPEILEIQVHFVPYPDPYPFHTRIMACRTHPPSPPFVDIQVYSTSSSSSSSSDSDSDDWKRKQVLACSSCPTGLMNILYMCICISIVYVCVYFYIYIYIHVIKPLWQGPDQNACWQLLVPYVRITAERSIPVFWAIPIYILYYIYIYYITKGLKNITDSLFGSKDDLFWPANRMIGPAERMDIRWIMGMGVWGWYCPWESQITTLPWKLTFESIKTMKKGPHVFFSALWVFLLNFWGMPKNAPQSGWFQMLKHV